MFEDSARTLEMRRLVNQLFYWLRENGRRACNALKLPNQHNAKHSPEFSARCSESHAMAVPNFQIWNNNSVTISNSKSISDSKATSNIHSRIQHNLKFKEPLNVAAFPIWETNNSNPESTSSWKAFSTQRQTENLQMCWFHNCWKFDRSLNFHTNLRSSLALSQHYWISRHL